MSQFECTRGHRLKKGRKVWVEAENGCDCFSYVRFSLTEQWYPGDMDEIAFER